MPQQLPQILILAFLLLLVVTECFQPRLSCFQQRLPVRNEIAEIPRHVGKRACGAWTAGAGSCRSDGSRWEPALAFQSWIWVSSEENTKREHVANFKPMAVKIHRSCIFLFLGKNDQFLYLCPFSAGSAFVIAKDLASKDSERKMSFILPMQNNTNYTSTAWCFHRTLAVCYSCKPE